MRLICLNKVVPEMKHAPHKIYMLEFDHSKGELAEFTLMSVPFLKRISEFADITDKTTLNVIGVEGDKEGRVHDNIKNTHALVADLRPLGIYFLFWAKAETPEGFQKALTTGLLSTLMTQPKLAKKASRGGKLKRGGKRR